MNVLEKRFGTLAVRSGMISLSQLQDALKLQVRENVEGKPHRLIGIILRDLGHMDKNQVLVILRKLAAD